MAMTGGTAKLVSSGTPSSWPGAISLYVYYKEKSQSVANNQTVLSLGMYVTTPSGYYFGPWADWNGSYIGTATSGSNCKTFDGACPSGTQGTYWLVEDQEITLTHNSDGSKSATIYWKWGVNSSWGGFENPSGSFSISLTTIPRASEITSASDVNLGSKCSIKWTPKAASFRYKLKFSLGDWSYTTGAIHPNKTSAYTYTGYVIPLDDDPDSVAAQIPNAKSGEMTVTLYTYSNSGATTQVGDADTATFTVTVPENTNTKPTVTIRLEPVSSLDSAFDGLYIQGKTKVKATVATAAKYGATIKSTTMSVEGKSYDAGDSYTSEYLSMYGDITVTAVSKDSRGFSTTVTSKITVIAYDKPKILNAEAVRCDADGNLSDSGTYLKISAKRSYSPVVSGGEQKNFCKIRYRYKLESAASYSSWETILAGDSLDSDEIATGALLDGVLAANSSYLVQVQAIDDVGGYGYTTITIPTDKVYMHRDKIKRALAFGKYIEEENCVDIAEDITLKVRGPIVAQGGGTIDSLMQGTKITATAETSVSLNDFKDPGNYYSQNADNSQYITDSPYTAGGFGLIVREMQTPEYLRQELFYGRTTWIRHFDGTSWSDWWRYLTTTIAETAATDFVTENGTEGGWTYKKWKSGTYQMFGTFTVTPSESTLNGTLYRTNNMTIAVPFAISSAYVSGSAVGHYWITNGGPSGTSAITLRLMSDKTFSTTTAIEVRLEVVGNYT